MEKIYYKYKSMNMDQFAIFEENMPRNDAEMEIKMSTSFSYDKASNLLCNIVVATIGDESAPFLKASMKSYFLISLESIGQITNEQGDIVFPVQPLIQFASLNYGSLRGALHVKTQGTKFAGIVLPPVFLSDVIKANYIVRSND